MSNFSTSPGSSSCTVFFASLLFVLIGLFILATLPCSYSLFMVGTFAVSLLLLVVIDFLFLCFASAASQNVLLVTVLMNLVQSVGGLLPLSHTAGAFPYIGLSATV